MYRVATDPVLEEITRVIVDGFAPERVVLFGSRARGDHRADSDYDVIVVLEAPLDPAKGEAPIRAALSERGLNVDVITYSPAEFERRRDDVGTLACAGEVEGRVLYDRNPARWTRRVRETRPGPPPSFADWLERARNDFDAMHATMVSAPRARDTIAYLAHQGVEKLLKAVLISRFTPPPRTHDLVEILRRTPPELRDDPGVASSCASLNALWPKMRYPESPIPSNDETAAAVENAEAVRKAIVAAFSLDVR